MITRDQLNIVRSTAEWGGEILTITVNDPPNRLDGSTFRLRSPKGLKGMSKRDHYGFVVDEHYGEITDDDRGTWHGSTDAEDAEAAIDEIVDHLNELVARDRVNDATCSALSELRDALSDFDQSLEHATPRDFRDEWKRAKAAIAAIDMAMESVEGV